ncbi:MAG: GldG family protein [Acidobacteria bacterium]|nr:GldG family protein [Acidobacteriota bacterium]
MKTRQTQYAGYFVVYTVVILAVLGAANWLANRHSTAYDSTSNKRFSLADQTEKVVRGLKNNAKVLYFSGKNEFPRAKDLLDRYSALSPKLSIEYIDPDAKPTVAKAYGVRTMGTIFVESGNKREEARSLSEEEVTSALIRALKTGERMVCFVSGSGEHTLEDTGRNGLSSLKELVEKNNYKTQVLKLVESPAIPQTCTVVVVSGPRFDYTQPAVDNLDKFYKEGGRVLVAMDPPLGAGKETISDNPPLAKALEGWGFTLQKNLLLDTSGVGQLFGLSEVVPLVTTYESHLIVRDMKDSATAFPLARSVDVKNVPNATNEKLFSTSGNSFATSNLASAEIRINPDKDAKGPFAIGAAGQWTVGKDNKFGRAVVVGSSGFMANSIIRFNGNRDLVMNMLNWLSSDEDLISIRPKDPADRRLSLTRSQMRTVFYSSVIMLPLLVIAAGLRVWWQRR